MDAVFRILGAYVATGVNTTVNGSGGHASLGTVTTHIDPANRGVYDGQTGYLVIESVARAIWQAQGGSNTVVAVTEPHLTAAAEKIANALYRYSVLDLAAAGGIAVRVRLSDMMSLPDWNAITDHALADDVARKVVEKYINDEDFATLVAPAPRLALYALVANALHRHQTEGHNWFTGDTTRKNTPTGRLLGVAGSDRTAFSAFMAKNGHDLWHFMDTASMNAVVDGMTGNVNMDLAAGYRVRGVVATGGRYSMALAASLGTSATDRWPPGTVGISAVILAVPIIGSMFDHITMRVENLDITTLTTTAAVISGALKTARPDRAVLLNVRNAMQNVTSIAVGFMSAVNVDSAERYASLFAFANRDPTSFESGVLLGKWAKGKDMVDAAVGNRIKALIASATTSLENVARLLGANLPVTSSSTAAAAGSAVTAGASTTGTGGATTTGTGTGSGSGTGTGAPTAGAAAAGGKGPATAAGHIASGGTAGTAITGTAAATGGKAASGSTQGTGGSSSGTKGAKP